MGNQQYSLHKADSTSMELRRGLHLLGHLVHRTGAAMPDQCVFNGRGAGAVHPEHGPERRDGRRRQSLPEQLHEVIDRLRRDVGLVVDDAQLAEQVPLRHLRDGSTPVRLLDANTAAARGEA